MNKCLSDNLPEQLYTARDCHEIDNRVIGSGKVSGIELMHRAGQFTFDCIRQQFVEARHLLVFCGSGNNGGDGYIIAGLAAEKQWPVRVFAYKPAATADCKLAREFAVQKGCDVIDLEDQPDISAQITRADCIVDALLGTGVDRDIKGYLATLTGWINDARQPVIACDIATGLNSDTGRVMRHCIKASVTCTFIALKPGLFTASGKTMSGQVQFSGLGLTAQDYSKNPACATLINHFNLRQLIRERPEAAHKGTTGFAVVLGGAPGMMGAVIMAGKAAYRVGCGRVKILTHSQHSHLLALNCPELLTHGFDECASMNDQFADINAIAIGPGLGQSVWAKPLFAHAMQADLPVVVDADGLNLLSQNKQKSDHWVLTPHPGEAATLLGCTSADIQNDRFAAAREIVAQYGGVCVLKGSGSLIASEHQRIHICRAGNAGQATAGMGDVLTGCVVGFIAQGYPLFDAACLATWCHASAADRIANRRGKIGMMATDLLRPVQQLHNELVDEKSC